MPKRPCAIAITSDDTTIICGDKTGDVYAFPLLVDSAVQNSEGNRSPGPEHQKVSRAPTHQASSSGVAVHTASNLQAQKNQIRDNGKSNERASIEFSPQLLLGHASMLTDLLLATSSTTLPKGNQTRHYIITADRDEHIRISRGLPQAHIIEGYCLGHKEFVSKICVPQSRSDLLISGGGDDCLCTWKWEEGRLMQRMNLREIVQDFVNSNLPIEAAYGEGHVRSDKLQAQEDGSGSLEKDEASKIHPMSPSSPPCLVPADASDCSEDTLRIAVAGIWAVTANLDPGRSLNENATKVLVACEG